MLDDIAHVRKSVIDIIESDGGTDVVVVMHSAGGMIGAAALEGLGAGARKREGKEGVKVIVGIAAAWWPEGHEVSR